MTTQTNSHTSLRSATDELREQLAAQVDLTVFDDEAESLPSRALATEAIASGDRAPGFTLPDVNGDPVELADLLREGPVVLVFYRGAWCPYCNLQLAAFREAVDEIEATGATLVAISPQSRDASFSLAEQQALRFPVLSDHGNSVAARYAGTWTQGEESTAKQVELGTDLTKINADGSGTLPVSSTFVIGSDGVVRFASISADYRWRVGPEEVLRALTGPRRRPGGWSRGKRVAPPSQASVESRAAGSRPTPGPGGPGPRRPAGACR